MTQKCNSQYDEFIAFSKPDPFVFIKKIGSFFWWLGWSMKNMRMNHLLKHHIGRLLGIKIKARHKTSCKSIPGEVLALQPGEFVEVKSADEIEATLTNGKLKGLSVMPGMEKHFGKRYRVHKRVETIILENTMEIRKLKNTVLLEDVMCDGKAFKGCDRSCFFYWREAWLKRV